MNFIIIATIILILLGLFYWFIFFLDYKISKLEIKIMKLLKERTDHIPNLFEITKDLIIRHGDVFRDILNLRKIEFSINNEASFIEFLKNERLIHHEMNFIYWLCLKNKKIETNWKFRYIRDLTINKSYEISEKIDIYKKIVEKTNFLIKIKNITFIWMFFPWEKRFEL